MKVNKRDIVGMKPKTLRDDDLPKHWLIGYGAIVIDKATNIISLVMSASNPENPVLRLMRLEGEVDMESSLVKQSEVKYLDSLNSPSMKNWAISVIKVVDYRIAMKLEMFYEEDTTPVITAGPLAVEENLKRANRRYADDYMIKYQIPNWEYTDDLAHTYEAYDKVIKEAYVKNFKTEKSMITKYTK